METDANSDEDLNFDDLESETQSTKTEDKIKAKNVGMSHNWDMVPVITTEEFSKFGKNVFDLVKNGRLINFQNDSLKNIYDFDSNWDSENLYLVSTRKR